MCILSTMDISKAHALYTQQLLIAYENHQTAAQVVWWLLEKATNKSHAQLLTTKTISEEVQKKIELWIFQIIQEHMPVQYILGTAQFLDIDITVQAPILIPRPETEEWCQKLIGQLKNTQQQQFKLLDLCSGTGCIALSVAHAFPCADVTALDINLQACKLIELNKKNNKISNCTIIESDLFTQLPPEKKYSIITANPPYITHDEWHELNPNVKNWESPQALVAQNNGLEIIERIVTTAPQYLAAPIDGAAQVWIEIGAGQGAAVTQLFKKAGYRTCVVLNDCYGKNRVVTGSL